MSAIRYSKYKEEYEVVDVKDGDALRKGRRSIIYKGKHYSLGDPQLFSGIKKRYALFSVILLVFFVIALLSGNEGSRMIYIVLPFVLGAFPLAYMCMAAGELLFVKGSMEHAKYDDTVVRVKRCTWAIFIFTAISAVCELIFMIRSIGDIDIVRELVYLASDAAMSLISIIFLKFQNSLITRVD